MIEPQPLWYIVNSMRDEVGACTCQANAARCGECRVRELWANRLAEQILAWEQRISSWDVLSKKVAITGILGSWKKR